MNEFKKTQNEIVIHEPDFLMSGLNYTIQDDCFFPSNSKLRRNKKSTKYKEYYEYLYKCYTSKDGYFIDNKALNVLRGSIAHFLLANKRKWQKYVREPKLLNLDNRKKSHDWER